MQTEEASDKIRDAVTPYVGFTERMFTPAKQWFQQSKVDGASSLQESMLPVSDLARRMREKLGHHRTEL